MTSLLKVALLLTVTSLASYSLAHSGRTDSNGGHNCSQKSIERGLCSGYHYHNTNIDQSDQMEMKVSASSETDHKPVKPHSHHHDAHDTQEG